MVHFNKTFNFLILQEIELTHKVPWIVVVYKFLRKWQETSGKSIPSNYKEKCELKKLIQNGKMVI